MGQEKRLADFTTSTSLSIALLDECNYADSGRINNRRLLLNRSPNGVARVDTFIVAVHFVVIAVASE